MVDDTERAYQKALFLLERRDHTEAELRQKLRDREFNQDTIDCVLSRLVTYGLIDDKRFTEHFLRYYGNNYSKRILSIKLMKKGIRAELFDSVYSEMMEELGKNPEQEALEKAVAAALRKTERKGITPDALSQVEKDKIIASLFRKGYPVSKIRSELEKAVES